MTKLGGFLSIGLLALGLIGAATVQAPHAGELSNFTPYMVTGTARAVDGNRIMVDDLEVRLWGIAAPERNEWSGSAAASFLANTVDGAAVRCRLTGKHIRKRPIGVCFMPDGQDVSAMIVAEGLALDCQRMSGGRYAHLESNKRLPYPSYCM